MNKPKYFKGSKKKKKALKEPVVEKSAQKHHLLKAESPKNSRVIPESSKKKQHAFLQKLEKLQQIKGSNLVIQGWNIFAIVLLFFIGGALITSLHTIKEKSAHRQTLVMQLHRWEDVSTKYPGYRDAYVQLAALSYQLGDKNQALAYIEKAQQLDPNNDTVVQLEESILKMGK